MQFRESSPPPYLNKSDQFRMLRMVGALVLVLFAMKMAANPGLWRWMFPGDGQNQTQQQQPAEKGIDYSVKFDEESPLAPDAFRSQLDEEARERASFSHHQPAVAESSPGRSKQSAGADKESASKIGDYVIEIDPQLLAPVSDGWFGIRKHEAPAFFTIIAKAQEIPLKLLEKAGDPRVDYTVLMTDSDQFRGRLLTVEGTVRLIESVSISRDDAAKDHGVDQYFVAWMWTDTSGNHPYRLIATSLPEDMPRGENLELPAKFTGYFFKKEGYNTEQGPHVAPVLIGKHLRWNRPPLAAAPGQTGDMGLAPYVIGFAVLIAAGLGLMIWRSGISDKKFGHQHVNHFTTATPSAFEDLAKLEPHDPSELFRQMEEEAQAAESESQVQDAGEDRE